MTGRSIAYCSDCRGQAFFYVDTDTEGDYPRCRFVCMSCGKEQAETELRGIAFVEVPF